MSLIARLTTYQLRTHYLLYHLLKKHFNGQEININDGNNWSNLEIFMPLETFYYAMDFTEEESKNWDNILSHSIWGLNKEELLTYFSWGGKEHMQKKFKQAETHGILFQPTKSGVELFMWAYGHGQDNVNYFFSEALEFTNDQAIRIGESVSTKEAKDKEENKNNS